MKLNETGAIILTDNEKEIFNYVKENGGRVAMAELAEATGRAARSVSGTVTALGGGKNYKDSALLTREKVADEEGKEVTYVILTETGKTFSC